MLYVDLDPFNDVSIVSFRAIIYNCDINIIFK
jgi:hypothetical protein